MLRYTTVYNSGSRIMLEPRRLKVASAEFEITKPVPTSREPV